MPRSLSKMLVPRNLKLASNTVIYMGTSVLSKAIPFLVLPVLTYYLSPSSYGLLANALVLTELLVIFIGLNAQAFVRVHFFKMDVQRLYGSIRLTLFQVVALGCGFSILLTIAYRMSLPAAFPGEYLWVPLIAALQVAPLLLLTIWQCEHNAGAYARLSLVLTFTNFGLSLLFIVGFGMDWQGRLAGVLIANLLGTVATVFLLARRGAFSRGAAAGDLRGQLAYGAGLLPNAIAWWARTGIDRFILLSLVGLDAVGLYTAALQISLVVLIVGESLNQALAPHVYERLAAGAGGARHLLIACAVSFGVLILAYAALFGFSPLLYIVLGEHFHPAVPLLKLLALGYVFHGVTLILNNVLYYYGRVKLLSAVTVAGSAIHVALAWTMTRAHGLDGVVLALPLSSVIMLGLSMFAVTSVWKQGARPQ